MWNRSGNLGFSQGNLKRMSKGTVREFQNFPKIVLFWQSPEKYYFYKLQIFYGDKQFHKNRGLECYFTNLSCKALVSLHDI